MSSSMDDAISGVRSSVISFANNLADRGINAQIGSIGYSGPGNIATEFINSSCEDLGPFQNLTDPVSFKNHVAEKWYAFGGCDVPENALEAIKYAHNHISWRDGAARAYIDITDVSHHTKNTNCNDTGPCTNQTLDSITNLVKEKATIHAVASQDKSYRTAKGGLDPWKLAENTGGKQLILPYDGYVDLTKIGVTDVIGRAFKFTFQSGSPQKANHTIRIRVEVNGKVAELAPALVKYKKIDSSLEDFVIKN